MIRVPIAVALLCIWSGGEIAPAGPSRRSIALYYIPFHVETLVGVTTDTIREEAHSRFRIDSEERIIRVLQAVATETPSGPFYRGHVRLLVEQSDGSADIFVDAEGHVLRGGEKFTLGPAKFSALKALLQEIAPPS